MIYLFIYFSVFWRHLEKIQITHQIQTTLMMKTSLEAALENRILYTPRPITKTDCNYIINFLAIANNNFLKML